jgi:ABC-type phosphate/phosphonate transport system permease subunit
MRIGFIGAGKVGFTLGKYLEQKLNKDRYSHVFILLSSFLCVISLCHTWLHA